MSSSLVVGSRASRLALAQTDLARAALAAVQPSVTVMVKKFVTTGDAVLDRPLTDVGGKALFVSELEAALRAGDVRLAVHSGKDLPSTLPGDMRIVAYLPRADPRDALIAPVGGSLASLPRGSRIGTSSPRRACQLRGLRRDFDVRLVRGNVHTRIAKLNAGDFDALVLAAAGLERLGLLGVATEIIPLDVMLPCAAQGAIAIEARADDDEMMRLGAAIDHPPTATAVTAERAFLEAVGGDCDTPLAAHAHLDGDTLRLSAFIGSVHGEGVSAAASGPARGAAEIGRTLAPRILNAGGADLLQAFRLAARARLSSSPALYDVPRMQHE